jgi:ABC-2 type transport system ATP-binding protein
MSEGKTLMKIQNLEKQYPAVKALDNISLEISGGQIIGLLGPNMSGKTTLLKAIAGLDHADTGTITYPDNARGTDIRRSFSFMPDTLVFPPYMNAGDAFRFYADMYNDYCAETAGRLCELLELPMKRQLKRLSKGMQERVALALTFSRKVPLYMLDEPLGGIDPVGKVKIMEAILTAPDENSTILLSTHLVKDVENIFDSVVFIAGGKVIFHEQCEEIRAKFGKTVEQMYLEMFLEIPQGGVL